MSAECRTIDFVACDYLGTRGAFFPPGPQYNHDFTEASDLVFDELAHRVNFHSLSTPAECFGWGRVAFTQEVGPKRLTDFRSDRVCCHWQLVLKRLSIHRIKHLVDHVDDNRGFHASVRGDHVNVLMAFLRRQKLQGVIGERQNDSGVFTTAKSHHPWTTISLVNALKLADSVR
ncbi:hypothetical protein D3C76_1107670 [compost metagenome]